MKKLTKQERKQLYICQERVRDVQIRLETVREILVKKGFLIEDLPDAFEGAKEALKGADWLASDVLREDDNIKR